MGVIGVRSLILGARGNTFSDYGTHGQAGYYNGVGATRPALPTVDGNFGRSAGAGGFPKSHIATQV